MRLGRRSPEFLFRIGHEFIVIRIESGACYLDLEALDCLKNSEVGSQT